MFEELSKESEEEFFKGLMEIRNLNNSKIQQIVMIKISLKKY